MGVGAAIFAGSLVICAAAAVVLVVALRRPKRVERQPHVWNPAGRLCQSGLVWPECSDDEYCGCRDCHDYGIGELSDHAIRHAFLGIVLAERARESA